MNNELKQTNEIKIITYLCENIIKDGFHINVETEFSSYENQSIQDVIKLFKDDERLIMNVYDENNENEIGNIFVNSDSEDNDGYNCIMFVRLDDKLKLLKNNLSDYKNHCLNRNNQAS